MTRTFAILRPEPGNAATAARIAAAGHRALRMPLFAVRPLGWAEPDPADHDALFLTSANAVRHAGPALAGYARLPLYAVGAATAAAARAAGLRVTGIGDEGAAQIAERAARDGVARALHLAGRERAVAALRGVTRTVEVYASEPTVPAATDLAGLDRATVLIHSPRAGARFAELVSARGDITVIAISAAAAHAVGSGWRAVAVAVQPNEDSLLATAFARHG